jgi:hypothetical protein
MVMVSSATPHTWALVGLQAAQTEEEPRTKKAKAVRKIRMGANRTISGIPVIKVVLSLRFIDREKNVYSF